MSCQEERGDGRNRRFDAQRGGAFLVRLPREGIREAFLFGPLNKTSHASRPCPNAGEWAYVAVCALFPLPSQAKWRHARRHADTSCQEILDALLPHHSSALFGTFASYAACPLSCNIEEKKDEISTVFSSFRGLGDDAPFCLPPSRFDCRHIGIGICSSQCQTDNFAVLGVMSVFGACADRFIIILGIFQW